MITLLLKTQQELHKNNTKWNKVIDRIKKELDIGSSEKDLIDDIVREVFNETK
jgi:hypothetical protein